MLLELKPSLFCLLTAERPGLGLVLVVLPEGTAGEERLRWLADARLLLLTPAYPQVVDTCTFSQVITVRITV